MTPFARDGACEDCGRQYTVSGVSVAPGTETEAPARFRCECGGWLSAFVPGRRPTTLRSVVGSPLGVLVAVKDWNQVPSSPPGSRPISPNWSAM